MKRPLKFPLKYEKAIRLITRKGTAKEAERPFKGMLVSQFRYFQTAKWRRTDERLVQEKVEELVQHLKEEGFDQIFFERCCGDYAAMPRRAPRERVKKEFDAKGLPKMPKTPENRAIMREFIRIRQQNLGQKSASGELKLPKTG
jgi:hypothetical protein